MTSQYLCGGIDTRDMYRKAKSEKIYENDGLNEKFTHELNIASLRTPYFISIFELLKSYLLPICYLYESRFEHEFIEFLGSFIFDFFRNVKIYRSGYSIIAMSKTFHDCL